ncbi:winged helix-turn-helix domain-containing protein [Streptomyces zaomyceticus]
MDSGPGADGDLPPAAAAPVGGDGVALKRQGWFWQAPARRAVGRDEHVVELRKKEVWPQVKGSRRRVGAESSSRTRPDSP